MALPPQIALTLAPGEAFARLRGAWTLPRAPEVEARAAELSASVPEGTSLVLDLEAVDALDTLGVVVLHRLRATVEGRGGTLRIERASSAQQRLLSAVQMPPPAAPAARPGGLRAIVEDIGAAMVSTGRDIREFVAFLGQLVVALGRQVVAPGRFRGAAFVNQLELTAFRSVPIIALISFLVGCIVAQQTVFQLRNFGTTAFVADLLGILVLRELGVLLTAIMIAGRSGSAITAELGSMKMREEVDALRTMGLNPMDVLIAPRVLALVVGLPLLTIVANMAALFGGGLVALVYGDVSPDVFLGRLRTAIGLNTFMVGIIKAPVMALVIGLIASMEGLAVRGSAQSLGEHTTASVVKAIFVVIVVDGLFAIFFASIRY